MGARAFPDIFKPRRINPTLTLLPANSLTFDDLYTHYADSGFLYPEKRQKLAPHLDLIRDNWTRGWQGGRDLLLTQIYREHNLDKTGTVTVWKSTGTAWQSQHLTSQNYAAGILYLLLYAQDEGIQMHYGSGQNWYSPTNKFAMKIYGRMDRVLGNASADSRLLNYLQVNPSALPDGPEGVRVIRCTDNELPMVKHMAQQCRGKTFCRAEELDVPDLGLDRLDMQYRRYGLGRKRYIWMALDRKTHAPKGMLVAYRGPFGFNFSFLENRCDLMTDPFLTGEERAEVCRTLLRKAAPVYLAPGRKPHYPLSHLVVMADAACTKALEPMGAVKTRQYYHGIWLEQGFEKWKKYMQRIFSPVIRRYEKKQITTPQARVPAAVPMPLPGMFQAPRAPEARPA